MNLFERFRLSNLLARRLSRAAAFSVGAIALLVLGSPRALSSVVEPPESTVTTTPVETEETKESTSTKISESGIKPRAECRLASVSKLVADALKSRSALFVDELRALLIESLESSADGLRKEDLDSLVELVSAWPDSSVQGAAFAPDLEGKPRWAIRIDWPIDDLKKRVLSLLALDATQQLFRGVKLVDAAGGGFVLKLPTGDLANLVPLGGSQSIVASHADLTVPAEPPLNPAGFETDPPLLVCRLNLAGTEKDSGAMFGGFNMLTAATYAGRVNTEGEWIETVQVDWPPLSGMGAKALFGRVKQTFFAPESAFVNAAINSTLAPTMLESAAGFGPQFIMNEGGGFEMLGEESLGPLASRFDSELAVTVLPGTGFLPAPDIVIQTRTRRAEHFADDVRKAVETINKAYRERDMPEPWKEETVRGRQVFCQSGSRGGMGGFLMPLNMNPVVFQTKETDAKGKERDFLIVAWTSTSPANLVKRWLDLPRPVNRKYLPTESKTDGEVWVNWKSIYRWVHPYFDVALSAASLNTMFPKGDVAAEKLSDASITFDLKYAGLAIRHRGPLPMGVLAVPTMITASLADDSSSGSDLAREREARHRLRVLHHHATLFRKDIGRWPAEVAELDGYVDFRGHPELLRLDLSSRAAWSEWLSEIVELAEEKEKEEEAEDDITVEIKDDLFVVDWRRDRWSLGFKPNTFVHLEKLYIDQDGMIHRVERKEASKESQTAPQTEKVSEAPTSTVGTVQE